MKKAITLIALCALMIVLTSCGDPSEGLVSKYFQVMQMLDKDSMSSMAFNPVEIEFTEYKITSSTEPYEVELLLPKYLSELEELKKEKRDITLKANEIEGAIIDLEYDIEDTRSSKKKAELKKEIETKQTELDTIKFDFTKLLQIEYDLEQLIEREQALVKKSSSITENLQQYHGVIKKSEVMVNVTLPAGKTNDYVFLMLTYELTKEGEEDPVPGRMIIENILTKADYDEMKSKAAPQKTKEVTAEEVTEETPQKEEEKTKENQEEN